VPLTDEQIVAANYPDGEENGATIAAPDVELIAFARAIEANLGITKGLAAQPAVPDAITDDSESLEYRTGWNDCRAEMLKARAA
jgi:hypothetical protein